MNNAFSKIKQPTPNISSATVDAANSEGKKYKVIKPPNVGVIKIPKVSITPVTDWIEINRKEHPYRKYKSISKDKQNINLQNISALTVLICGLASCVKLFKK